ncbi:pyridoxamine kinase [Aureimonas sp. Leaf460]|uniref:pyridoxal kinase PdxY n=2 Tax=unclassified Aureimonas TaxID=2615206 RepID=UPI0006FCD010|nr:MULTISPECIES: pyridoxal kinase PdxY [unclassified Aureimonas]KQT52611.1 pyridoxamine kinase [Aureimonas sp. Leaf427]KQT77490.1 pyridoxamine kinase [Aureimonas sp. Leaf460]
MSMTNPSDRRDKPAVISVSSHVARGTVGNRAVVFALESLGFPVWSVPTITLPWHPGHGPATRIVAPAEDFTALMEDLATAPWLSEVGAIVTGYFGAPHQVEPAARLVEAVKAANPQAIYLCDPVTGDGGRLYQPEPTLAGIRDRLMPLADIATPNRFELEFLTGLEFHENAHLIDAAQALGPPTVVVTSAFPLLRGGIGNLLVDGTHALLAEHRQIERAPHGLGDLTSAVFLARILSGATPEKALQTTTAAVYEILARTTKRGADELTLETDAESLKHPMAMVQMRRLGLPNGNRRA